MNWLLRLWQEWQQTLKRASEPPESVPSPKAEEAAKKAHEAVSRLEHYTAQHKAKEQK